MSDPQAATGRAERTERTVVVLRHAQAAPQAPTDAERPLTDRGRAQARACGAWLAAHDLHPDVALVSAALRTRQTWEAVHEAAGWTDGSTRVRVDQGLYVADEATVLDLLAGLPAEARRVLVVGHNPTMSTLAHLLENGEGDPEAVVAMAGGFPTAGMAVFAQAAPWSALGPGSARLVAFAAGDAGRAGP